MRKSPLHVIEYGRILTGDFATEYGQPHGMFQIGGLKLISSGPAAGWEHVSVSRDRRIPHWREMCKVKEWFWEDEETVMQLHPPRSTYVNFHPYALHLWRPIDITIPLPPLRTVGP